MSRVLPARPNFDHLKKQAKDLLPELQEKSPGARLADAQHVVAREYGFPSWPKLKEHLISLVEGPPQRNRPFAAMTIRPCEAADVPEVYAAINDAAVAYRGVIAADCWHEPYMPLAELQSEIASGVRFWGCVDDGKLVGVMGLQDVADVTLVRHAYTRIVSQGSGVGSALLNHLRAHTDRKVLIGTWKAATWAVKFYQRHGFRLVPESETPALLRKYWTVSPRQIEESVVLVSGEV